MATFEMGTLQTQVLSGIGLLAGPWLMRGGFRDLHLQRLIDNTPTARIRSMAMGLVEVQGSVEARSLVRAPFSGRECAYWQIEVATRTGRRNSWNTVHRNSSGQPFFLRDETGLALVYPHGADCRVNFGVEEECMGLTLPDCYGSYLSEHCGASSMVWRLSTLRFRERILEDGQQVFVLGSAMPRPQAHTVSEGEAMQATGTDGPWTAPIRTRSASVSALIRRGENEKVFIISQQSERTLTAMLGFTGWAKLAGGPLLSIVCLWVLLESLK